MKIFSILAKNYWKIEIELFRMEIEPFPLLHMKIRAWNWTFPAITHENQSLPQVFLEWLFLET